MTTPSHAVIEAGRARAVQHALPYAGALLPHEAWALYQANPENIVIVDIRSAAEWQFVGGVPNSVCIEYKSFPGMILNPDFLAQLRQQVPQDKTVLFLCRTGARSHDTSILATEAGYSACYNILEGFEGDKDAAGHRGVVNGWKARQLPWLQN